MFCKYSSCIILIMVFAHKRVMQSQRNSGELVGWSSCIPTGSKQQLNLNISKKLLQSLHSKRPFPFSSYKVHISRHNQCTFHIPATDLHQHLLRKYKSINLLSSSYKLNWCFLLNYATSECSRVLENLTDIQ